MASVSFCSHTDTLLPARTEMISFGIYDRFIRHNVYFHNKFFDGQRVVKVSFAIHEFI